MVSSASGWPGSEYKGEAREGEQRLRDSPPGSYKGVATCHLQEGWDLDWLGACPGVDPSPHRSAGLL